MAEVRSGLRSILSDPRIYASFQRLIGTREASQDFVETYLAARPGQSMLDIGCGTADILRWLTDVSYVGFDPSAAYIAAATQRYGDRGRFFVAGIDDIDPSKLGGQFDVVLAKGVLHHVDDLQAERVFSLARAVVADGGRVVTLDGSLEKEQPRLARFLIRRDRGRNVRSAEGYADIARRFFSSVAVTVRHDRLRVPYTHAILVCQP